MNQFSEHMWKDERNTAYLTQKWSEGASGGFIARALGTTRGSILGKVYRLNLGKRAPDGQSKLRPRRPRQLRPKIAVKMPSRTVYIEPEYIPVDPIRFLDKRRDQCSFISGDPRLGARAPEIMCCGARTINNSAWCQVHHRLVYQPEKSRDRRAPQPFWRAA